MSLKSRHLLREGLDYTVNAICRHNLVNDVYVETQEFYKAIIEVERKGLFENLIVYVADVYILTLSDVHEVLYKHPDVNCIVVISNWDHYTEQAKRFAKENGIGLFTLSEFLEALNHRGKKFLDIGCAKKVE